MGQFERKFQTVGSIAPTTICWCQKTRMIALSCGIKIIRSAQFGFVTKHACDTRTDGRTELRVTTPKIALAQLRRAVKIDVT